MCGYRGNERNYSNSNSNSQQAGRAKQANMYAGELASSLLAGNKFAPWATAVGLRLNQCNKLKKIINGSFHISFPPTQDTRQTDY